MGRSCYSPPPKIEHSEVAHARYEILIEAVRRSGDPSKPRRVYLETGYQLSHNPDSWLQPDVSVRFADQHSEGSYLQGSPLLAVEDRIRDEHCS